MRLLAAAPLAFALSFTACGGSTADDVATPTPDASIDGARDAPDDGGFADASCPALPVHCQQGHCVDDPPAVCQNGQWVCPAGPPSCYADAGRDAGPGTFACGPTLTCNGATEYCYEATGGPPPPPDSGPAASYACKPLPASCGVAPTCACLPSMPGCWCTAGASGGLTQSCAFP